MEKCVEEEKMKLHDLKRALHALQQIAGQFKLFNEYLNILFHDRSGCYNIMLSFLKSVYV